MPKTDTLKDVKARIRDLINKQETELQTIQEKQEAATEQLKKAEAAIHDATEAINFDAYEKATEEKKKARAELDMYSARISQILQRELISETDSDCVIDSLLNYEKKLAEDFRAAISEPLEQLRNLYDKYTAAVADTENTINTWTSDIHANYRSKGTIYRETGTNRSPRPIPVHQLPYIGCNDAVQLKRYLDQAEAILNSPLKE